MNSVSHWMHVDLFTVDQAAALWAGFDPARIGLVPSFQPSEFVAAKQMLCAGIASGEISADSKTNSLARIGNYSDSLVSRDDLEAFARKRSLFPAFLFDTLAPFESTGHWLEDRDFPRASITKPPQSAPPVNRGGRPQEYDWNSFVMEIIRQANQPDGLPEKQADLVREMLTWFLQRYGKEPAESAVKDRISKIYRYLAAAKNRDD